MWLVLGWVVLSVAWPGSARSDEQDVVRGITSAHNRIRDGLGLPGLVWSDELAGAARDWAEYLARENDCRMRHHGTDWPYGENLFWASGIRYGDGRRELQDVTAAAVFAAWAGEAIDYDYDANRCRPGRTCGHYTQVVWRDTRTLGCGWAVCADSGQIWVCEYDPPGNFIGQKPY